MPFPWSIARRRQEILHEPIPRAWQESLKRRVRHYPYLNDDQRRRLEGFVQVVAAEKDWVGGSGFQLTEEMKVTIAGYAGVMTLGLAEPYYFDRLKTIIVYATGYMPHESSFSMYQTTRPLTPRLGEAWHRGPVVLSWKEIVQREKLRPGNNLVIHEFAHHVDSLDGDLDGSPPIVGREKTRRWYKATEEEFQRLRNDVRGGEPTLLDRYGASDRAEFFAVASECFFERPHAMRQRHPQLYAVLADFYCQDVAVWLPDAESQVVEDRLETHEQGRRSDEST
jgi:Mlc titration factor MtfA (ptsG expression regulator)